MHSQSGLQISYPHKIKKDDRLASTIAFLSEPAGHLDYLYLYMRFLNSVVISFACCLLLGLKTPERD